MKLNLPPSGFVRIFIGTLYSQNMKFKMSNGFKKKPDNVPFLNFCKKKLSKSYPNFTYGYRNL